MIKEREYSGYIYEIHDCGTENYSWAYIIYCPYSGNEISSSEHEFSSMDEADREAKKKIDELCEKEWS